MLQKFVEFVAPPLPVIAGFHNLSSPVFRKHKDSVPAGEEEEEEEEENRMVMTGGEHQVKHYYKCCEPQFFIQLVAIVMLVLFAGLMSGLTLGLMSMSLFDLEVLAKSGTPKDRLHACIFPTPLYSPILCYSCFRFLLRD